MLSTIKALIIAEKWVDFYENNQEYIKSATDKLLFNTAKGIGKSILRGWKAALTEKVSLTAEQIRDDILGKLSTDKVITGAREWIANAMKNISRDITENNMKDRVLLDVLIQSEETDSEYIIPYFRAVFGNVFPDYIKERITFDDFLSKEDKKLLAFDFNDRIDNKELFGKKKEVLSDVQELYSVLQSLNKPWIWDEVLTLLVHPEKAKSAEYSFVSVNTEIPEWARRLLDNLLQKVNTIQEERDKEIDDAKDKLFDEEQDLNQKEHRLIVESLKRSFIKNESQKILHYLDTNFSLELSQYFFKTVEDDVIRNMFIKITKSHIEQDDIPELKKYLSKSEYVGLKAEQ